MINITTFEEGLPISIVIPTTTKREKFFNEMVLPMAEYNMPRQIIVVCDEGNACKQRNIGLSHVTEPYVLFLDDDVLLPQNYLTTLYEAINDFDVAYTGYVGIVLNPHTQPNHNFRIKTIDFDYEKLKKQNYISTMSLIKTSCLKDVCWDENIKRLQDWDLWLALYKKGCTFVAVHGIEFYAFYNDEGLTSNKNISYQEAYNIIKNKHNLYETK